MLTRYIMEHLSIPQNGLTSQAAIIIDSNSFAFSLLQKSTERK